MSQYLPEDHESERSLIASLCAPGNEFQARDILPILREADFMTPQHRLIIKALQKVLSEDSEVSSLTLRDALQRAGDLNMVGGLQGLLEVLTAEEVGRPGVLAAILRRKRRQRELIHLGSRLVKDAASEGDPDEILETASQGLHEILKEGTRSETRSALEIYETIKRGDAFGERIRNVIRFGIPTLDHYLVAPPGGMVLLGARPGIGKTALLTQVSCQSAKAGERVLTITLELTMADMESRIASYLTKQSAMNFRAGSYDQRRALEGLNSEHGTMARMFTVSPNQGSSWARIESEIRRNVDRNGVTAICIDYFSLIGRTVGKGSSEAYAYAAVSEGITALAKELGIGILLLAQLVKDSDGVKPTLSNFADSDRPARDAWAAVLMWRDKDQTIQASISKNRGGRVGGNMSLILDGATNTFVEHEREICSTSNYTNGRTM